MINLETLDDYIIETKEDFDFCRYEYICTCLFQNFLKEDLDNNFKNKKEILRENSYSIDYYIGSTDKYEFIITKQVYPSLFNFNKMSEMYILSVIETVIETGNKNKYNLIDFTIIEDNPSYFKGYTFNSYVEDFFYSTNDDRKFFIECILNLSKIYKNFKNKEGDK